MLVFLASFVQTRAKGKVDHYLSVGDEAVSAVLVQETVEEQKPVYFVSRVLQGFKLRYQKLEQMAYALLTTARRLRHYLLYDRERQYPAHAPVGHDPDRPHAQRQRHRHPADRADARLDAGGAASHPLPRLS